MQLNNKIVVLTGATGGIGQAIAEQLAEQGARLVLAGRNNEKLEALKARLQGSDRHSLVQGDLRFTDGRLQLLEACQSLGHIDVLINNAGISQLSLFQDMTSNEIEDQVQTNLLSPMLVTKTLLSLLHKADESIILNIGSGFGSIGYPGFSSYCATKFGLRGFSEAISRELADSTIKVLYLAPRATKTNINSNHVDEMNTELGNKTDSPEWVAKAAVKQLKKTSKRVYLGFPEKLFVRVNAILPSIVDNALFKQLPIIRRFAKRAVVSSTVIDATPELARRSGQG